MSVYLIVQCEEARFTSYHENTKAARAALAKIARSSLENAEPRPNEYETLGDREAILTWEDEFDVDWFLVEEDEMENAKRRAKSS